MRLKTRHSLNTAFSMASMTDIVFLLLIFFMLTVSYSSYSALKIHLPVSTQSEFVPSQLKVYINDAHEYYIADQHVPEDQIAVILKQYCTKPGMQILLHMDYTVPVSCMIRVIDCAIALQAKVAVATLHEDHPKL